MPERLAALEKALAMPAELLGFGVQITMNSDDGVAGDAEQMESWRKADLRAGGGYVYATVVQYLQAHVAPRLVTGRDHGVFTSAAGISEMAAWMAFDAGHDQIARSHLARALDLAGVSRDRQVTAHILASLGHVTDHMGDPAETLRAATAGLDALTAGPRNPDLEAYLHAIGARGYAVLGERSEVTRCLNRAEQALQAGREEPRSPWVSTFDEGSLASEAARCMHTLGQLSEAARQAERVIALRPPDRPRSRAFGLFTKADVLAATGHPDEAAAIGADILRTTDGLGSYTITERFTALRRLLEPYKSSSVVSDFLARLPVRGRYWLPEIQ